MVEVVSVILYLSMILIHSTVHLRIISAGQPENAWESSPVVVDRRGASLQFDGIGGLSGGGATSRLLVDYKEPQRSQILDYLFKPNFGAALQILKVEIGGDSVAGCGAESSHMHSETSVNYKTGYEWWLMTEAKKRNPDIKLYGLPWSFPGWVGGGSNSPFAYPEKTASYIVKWLEGARDAYNLTIDFIGIWNERSSNATYVITLRKAMDSAGFQNTKVVAKDGGADICTTMAKDKAYANAVSVIGLHYPSDFSDYSVCHSFGKPFWASEESSSYDDANGAACWARVINSHWVLSQMTSSIMWNLIGSYYHGTNWYSESMMTALQPWSGHYWVSPVIWATAHVTQFTKVGWQYLKNASGSGQLPQGGYYVSLIDPKGTDFTIIIVKISYEHAPCVRPRLPEFSVAAENVTFQLDSTMGSVESLQCWYSNFEDGPPYTTFQRKSPISVSDQQFSVFVPVGATLTLTTLKTGTKGTYGDPPPSAPFPLPHSDNFDSYPESSEAQYFADQIGIYEIHPASADTASHKNVMRQMVPQTPIAWQGWADKGPLTLIGMREWQDVTVSVDFYVPESLTHIAMVCVATRSDQFWVHAIVLCISNLSSWQLLNAGPALNQGIPEIQDSQVISSGLLKDVDVTQSWHTVSLTTIDNKSSGTLDGQDIFSNTIISNTDTGFAGFGMSGWHAIEFDNFNVSAAGDNWSPKSPCPVPQAGAVLSARRCTTNGLSTQDQEFELLATYQIRHVQSGLCATASVANTAGANITLQECSANDSKQVFFYNYSNIRNFVQPLVQGSTNLAGSITTDQVSLEAAKAGGYWTEWVYFPNTFQLRNQYTSTKNLGYPRCLTSCPDTL